MQRFVVAMQALLLALLPMSKVMAYSGYVGESIYLSAPSTPGTIDGAAWSDGNSAQVKIDGNHYGATVTILSYFSGTITIQLKYAYSYYSGGKKQYVTGQYAYYDITCIPSTVTLDKKSVTLKPGEEVDLTYTNSSGYPLPDLTWTTSNYDVAYLESGYDRIAEDAKTIRVTANKPGECTIKCEGYSGNTAPTCKIIVKGDPPTAISLPATATTRVGESVTLSPTLAPKDAYTKISWKSSDESIATVSSGKVTGKKTGKVIITATTDNGLSATCSVTIGKGAVTLKADTESGVYAAGKTIKLTASRSDADIYYTLDGSTPTTNSTRYTGPITLNKSVTLKAIATGSNYDASDVLTRQYTITSLVVKDYWSETEEQTPFFIPSVTFSKAVSKNVACSNVKLQKGNTTVSGQSIVQDGILYFVPDSQLDVGNYKLIIPESAVMDANGEPNLKLEMNLKIGSGVERVTMIYGGDLYTSAIKADGTLWAWGDNALGRLGDGTRSNRYKPVKILDAVSQVSVGYGHTLAVKPDNTLWAWGRNNGGQLGVGTVGSLDTPTKVMDEAVKAYACEYHSFAIKADGSLWAWGNNGSGRLGDGTTTDRLTPVKIMDKVAHVVSESSHSMAIKTDGSLWAWGYNGYGQLGDGTTTNKLEPVKIMTNVVQIVSVNAVATLEASSFAIKTDGSLWAWGHNKYGQLGDGTTTNQLNPIKIMDNVVQVVTSRYTTMVIKADGSLWGWGRNAGGMLGDGTKTAKLKPTKIMDNVTQVTMGDNYSLAIKNDASLWAWGRNECAQLGDGTYTDRTTPIKVMDDVAQVTQGSKNGFALNTFAIKSDGTLWGWGDNGHGQLGDGTAIDRKKPICIIGSTAFEIVTGISFSSQVCQIPLGSHYLLLPRVSPVDGCYQTLDFKSSNPEIATVSSRGIVEAKKTGTTTITVTADGTYTATCKIEVKEGEAEVVISTAGYATFYDSKSAYSLPSGLSAQVVTNASNSRLTYKTIADGSSSGIIPSKTAVMLVSNSKRSGTYILTASDSKTTYSGTNMLHGSDEVTTTTGDGYHYKLSYGETGTNLSDVFGWYWGAQNGSSFQIDGHKAWLVVPKSAATRGFNIDGDATDIIDIEIDYDKDEYYDLQGRRMTHPSKKGIYIKNGKKVMIK